MKVVEYWHGTIKNYRYLRDVSISCDVKNKHKTATGTWHYVNRLVPKNDIKLL